MKISLKHQASQKINNESCTVEEHFLNDETIDFALATIAGRYPSIKQAVNNECKEVVYIKEGSGKIVVNGNEHLLNAGDVILIEPGEKFYWEGNLKIAMVCTPPWKKEQHKIVD